MSKYRTWVCLEMEDIVEAASPEEAFEILSDEATYNGSWKWDATLLEEEKSSSSADYEYACELKFD